MNPHGYVQSVLTRVADFFWRDRTVVARVWRITAAAVGVLLALAFVPPLWDGGVQVAQGIGWVLENPKRAIISLLVAAGAVIGVVILASSSGVVICRHCGSERDGRYRVCSSCGLE